MPKLVAKMFAELGYLAPWGEFGPAQIHWRFDFSFGSGEDIKTVMELSILGFLDWVLECDSNILIIVA